METIVTSEEKSKVLTDLEYLEKLCSELSVEELGFYGSRMYNLSARNIGRIQGTPENHLKSRYMAVVNNILKYLPDIPPEETTSKQKPKQAQPMEGVLMDSYRTPGETAVDAIKKCISKLRWNSFYHQMDEIVSINPESVLEIGVGTGLLREIIRDVFHIKYSSLDTGEHLKPDYVGSVLDIPISNKIFDVVGCFQVLEHLPYDNFEKGLRELFRVAKRMVVISLPNAGKEGKPNVPHQYDGEHWWEINKIGFEAEKVREVIKCVGRNFDFELTKEYRVKEWEYHHFFVLKHNG